MTLVVGSVTVKDWAAGDRTPSPSRAEATSLLPRADIQRSRLDREVIDDYLPATGAEYATGARLRGIIRGIETISTDSCMRRAGFHIPRTSAAAIAAGWEQIDFDNTQFPDLARAVRTITARPQFKGVNGRRRDAFNLNFGRCYEAAGKPFLPLTKAGDNLGASWWPIVTGVESSARVRATMPALRSCAERYGWPHSPKATIGSFSDFAGWALGHVDYAGMRGADQAKMTSLSRIWWRILVTCGRPAIEVQERLQSAQRAVYIRQHLRAVGALEALVVQVITQADRPGGAAKAG
jgi:hypothetical protein